MGGSGGTAVTGKARMTNMFAKAPAAKPKAKPAAPAPAARKRLTKPAAVVGDAEAMLAMEEDSESDGDDVRPSCPVLLFLSVCVCEGERELLHAGRVGADVR